MANKINLSNGRAWKSQTAAEAHFRQILHAYADGGVVSDASHHDDLVALLERYDTAVTEGPSKIGSGIVRFERRSNPGAYYTPSFWVVRSDGTATDFSFLTGVRGVPKSQVQEFSDACRAAVAGDLRVAKARHFQRHADGAGRVLCDVSDKPISIDEAHIDHAHPTFGVMVVMFRASMGWHESVPTGVLTTPQDAQTTTTFADMEVAARFRERHRRDAKLRMVSARENLAMGARQPTSKIKRPVELLAAQPRSEA